MRAFAVAAARAVALTAALQLTIGTCAVAMGQEKQTADRSGGVQAAEAMRFPSPEAALDALKKAAESGDGEAMVRLFGSQLKDLASGDEISDKTALTDFARRVDLAASVSKTGEDRANVLIGPDQYPFPIPLVQQGGSWYFDTAAGKEEILNRRIGENELQTIDVCRGIAVAQYEYYLRDRDDDGVLEYARNFGSTPGQKDGLYWATKPDEPVSPLGELVAQARAAGYGSKRQAEDKGKDDSAAQENSADKTSSEPRPYYGYVYKLLESQGEDAPGGKFNYVINGNMVAGFAVMAYPVEYGSSGIMTFIMNTNGQVYEKNLGEETAKAASEFNSFNPDDSWRRVQE